MINMALNLLSVIFEILLYYIFFHLFFEKALFSVRAMRIIYLLIGVFSFFLSLEVSSRYVKLTGYFAVMLCLALCYSGKIFIKLFLPFLFQAISIMVERCSAVLLRPMRTALLSYGTAGENFYFFAGVVLSNLIILLLLIALRSGRDYMLLQKQATITFPYYYGILFLLPVCMIFIIDRIYIMTAQLGRFTFVDVLPILLLTAITVGFYFFLEFLVRYQYERQKSEILSSQLEQERQHHVILLNKHQQFQCLRHDMKKHFNTIAGLIKNSHTKQALEYAQKQAGQLSAVAVIQTQYPLLDTILTIAEDKARQLKATFQCYVSMRTLDMGFIEIDELASLMNNILDNALEAISAIPQIERRKIWCHLVQQKDDYLHITVCNTIVAAVEIKDNMVQTSKENKNLHGFGLRNVKRIVDKYNGSYVLECNDIVFCIKILLPLKQEEMK